MRKFYKENRVFVILMGVAFVCIAIILAILGSYIVKSNGNNTYGNRLDGIKDVEYKNKDLTDMEQKISEMKKVSKVSINIHGKIVYFNVEFEQDTTVDEAKNVAINTLEFFDETHSNFYDLQYLFTREEIEEEKKDDSSEEEAEKKDTTFPMIGYKKATSTTITWSNNAK